MTLYILLTMTFLPIILLILITYRDHKRAQYAQELAEAEAERKRREAERKAAAAKKAAQEAEQRRYWEAEAQKAAKAAERAQKQAEKEQRENERKAAVEAKHAETMRRREELHQQKMRHLAELQAAQAALQAASTKQGQPKQTETPAGQTAQSELEQPALQESGEAPRQEDVVSACMCMAGKKFEEHTRLAGPFTVTEKLDGVRCLAICEGGSVHLLTRNGNRISGCDDVRLAILSTGFEGVLDGEMIARPYAGENRKKTYERTRADLRAGCGEMQFHVFDTLTLSEWRERRGIHAYVKRRARLDKLSSQLAEDCPVQIVPVLYNGYNVARAQEWMKTICDHGGEGVMLNLDNAVYEFRRSGTLLKLKPVSDADLRIIDVIPGSGSNTGRAGAIVVEYKGERGGVSSGLSAALRQSMLDNPAQYIGRVATIRYAEESTNASGKVSLRFPRFVELREIGKAVSYA